MKKQFLTLRRVLMLGLPLVLAGSAWEVRHLQQLRQPIEIQLPSPGYKRRADGTLWRDADGNITLNPQKIPVFHQLIICLQDEMQKHPSATSIDICQSIPCPKESEMELNDTQSLTYNRKTQTLEYIQSEGVGGYGWTYSHVESAGLKVLAKAEMEYAPISLSLGVNAQLRSHGWILTEQYLP